MNRILKGILQVLAVVAITILLTTGMVMLFHIFMDIFSVAIVFWQWMRDTFTTVGSFAITVVLLLAIITLVIWKDL